MREETTLHEVIATLHSFDINSVIIVEGSRPVGIITTKDARVRGYEHILSVKAVTARSVASSPLVTIDEEAAVEQAVALMKQYQIKHLPVVSGDKLVGIVSDSDITFAVPALLSNMEEVCHRKVDQGQR